jgi:branched-chain amino acid transport system ATP-binding protein
VISGFLTCDSGQILFKGSSIRNMPPHKVAHKGLVMVHQIPRMFRWRTVLDNLVTANWAVPGQTKAGATRTAEKMVEVLKFNGIKDELPINISGGQQKLLELAMKLMLGPDLFILDEPYHGVHLSMIEECNKMILGLNREHGKTFIVISHNLPVISALCSRVVVLNFGQVVAEGTAEEIKKNELVREIYLGGD